MKIDQKTTLVALAMLPMLLTAGCDDSEDPNVEDRAGDIAVVVDGERFEPEDMDQFEGMDLYYYLDADAQADELIYAFTSHDDVVAFMDEREPAIMAQEAEQLRFRAPLTYSKFYDLVDYGQLFGKLKKGQSISNLDAHPDYNNNDISSVKCRANAWTYLWNGFGFTGGALICRNINIENLSSSGWNAVTSSLEVTP